MTTQTTALIAFALAASEGRTTLPLNILGTEVSVKLANADTDGAAAIFRHAVAPMSGPPLHRHSREDEWFYVLRGEIPGDRWPANCSAPGRFRFCTARHRSHLSELQRCSRGDPGFGYSGRRQPIL